MCCQLEGPKTVNAVLPAVAAADGTDQTEHINAQCCSNGCDGVVTVKSAHFTQQFLLLQGHPMFIPQHCQNVGHLGRKHPDFASAVVTKGVAVMSHS